MNKNLLILFSLGVVVGSAVWFLVQDSPDREKGGEVVGTVGEKPLKRPIQVQTCNHEFEQEEIGRLTKQLAKRDKDLKIAQAAVFDLWNTCFELGQKNESKIVVETLGSLRKSLESDDSLDGFRVIQKILNGKCDVRELCAFIEKGEDAAINDWNFPDYLLPGAPANYRYTSLRMLTLTLLAGIENPEAERVLSSVLETSTDPEELRLIACAAGEENIAEKKHEYINAVRRIFNSNPDEDKKLQLESLIAYLPGEELIYDYIQFANASKDNWTVALTGLECIPSEKARSAYLEIYSGLEFGQRAIAASTLRYRPFDTSGPLLFRILEDQTEVPQIRSRALNWLAELTIEGTVLTANNTWAESILSDRERGEQLLGWLTVLEKNEQDKEILAKIRQTKNLALYYSMFR